MKARILPFMEQAAAYGALNQVFVSSAVQNSTTRTLQVNSFVCPSDGNVPIGTASFNGATMQIGYTSYPNNLGTIYNNPACCAFDGPAYLMGNTTYGPAVTLAMIRDGTSNTVIWSEFVRGQNGAATDGKHQIYQVNTTFHDATVIPLPTIVSSCQNATGWYLHSNGTPFDDKGGDWLSGLSGDGGAYSHIMSPNKKACIFSGGQRTSFTIIGASSNHAGGVNMGMLDGSVRFVKDSVNQAAWWAIATMAGGEVVGADAY